MPNSSVNMVEPVGGFKIKDMMMRYNLFVPRLYNWCISLGVETNKIMPSRAFCSDESQGYPIIMIARHFGAFPFNHGRVGGIVATDRHGPHASHGQDLVIIQASHVGYNPQTKTFGIYRRLQTTDQGCSSSCGKIQHVINWYEDEYQFAQHNILLHMRGEKKCITIDNQLLNNDRKDGLLLHLGKLIETDPNGQHIPIEILSTAKVFLASEDLISRVGNELFTDRKPQPIGSKLTANMFYYRRDIEQVEEGDSHLENNLICYMPQIITSRSPILTAAQINTQVEFDRTFRTIVKENNYHNKKLLFISGLNIDISPQDGQLFPLTKFVPWAAYIQDSNGSYSTMEQAELMQVLKKQSPSNPGKINLETAIQTMAKEEEVMVEL